MLGIHEGRHPTTALHLGDRVQGEGGLAGTFRSVHLHHAALRISTPEGQIQGERTGGDGFHPHPGGVSEPHDRALAEIALDLIQHQTEGLVPLGGGTGISGARGAQRGAQGRRGGGGLGISRHGRNQRWRRPQKAEQSGRSDGSSCDLTEASATKEGRRPRCA